MRGKKFNTHQKYIYLLISTMNPTRMIRKTPPEASARNIFLSLLYVMVRKAAAASPRRKSTALEKAKIVIKITPAPLSPERCGNETSQI
jgi:hypothetical protein